MTTKAYDIVTVGGGLGGSALATAMAKHGASVLVLERETRMRDRVRGEVMWPWGTAKLVRLGIYDALMAAGGHELPWLDVYRGPARTVHRDLATTTAPMLPATAFYHPQIQEALLEAAASAGAEVRRGARVRGIKTGDNPVVAASIGGKGVEIRSRLVVGADGRVSASRRWGGFSVQRDPDQTLAAGLLFDNMPAADDAAHLFPYPKFGLLVLLLPQGNSRVRSYLFYPAQTGYRFSGKKDIPRYIEESLKTGVPAEYYPESTEGRPWGQPLKKLKGAPVNLG